MSLVLPSKLHIASRSSGSTIHANFSRNSSWICLEHHHHRAQPGSAIVLAASNRKKSSPARQKLKPGKQSKAVVVVVPNSKAAAPDGKDVQTEDISGALATSSASISNENNLGKTGDSRLPAQISV